MIQRRAYIRRTGRKGKRTSRRRKARMSLAKQCAFLWAQWVKRNERCEFLGEAIGSELHVRCLGNLQAMHGFGKRAYPGVRYASWNGFSGCASVHTYFTWREPEWQNYLRQRWGNEVYEQRLREAMLTRKYDLSLVAETYRTALATGVDV